MFMTLAMANPVDLAQFSNYICVEPAMQDGIDRSCMQCVANGKNQMASERAKAMNARGWLPIKV